jgi:hypothetical protein
MHKETEATSIVGHSTAISVSNVDSNPTSQIVRDRQIVSATPSFDWRGQPCAATTGIKAPPPSDQGGTILCQTFFKQLDSVVFNSFLIMDGRAGPLAKGRRILFALAGSVRANDNGTYFLVHAVRSSIASSPQRKTKYKCNTDSMMAYKIITKYEKLVSKSHHFGKSSESESVEW